MTMTEETLLAGLAARPREVEGWLVLADWLEDRDDPRAELARLRYLLHAEPDSPERPARAGRQQELVATGLAPVVPTWTNSLGTRFALVLPDCFWRGSPAEEPDRFHDEMRHRVTLTEPYFLGTTPVTVTAFRRFVQATGYLTEAERDGGANAVVDASWRRDASVNWRNTGFKQDGRHPVVCVSWNDALALVTWLNQVETDRVYSLPTETQWECACRAGTATAYFWGDDPGRIRGYAWIRENAGHRTRPTATKKPNPWGFWHMHGHVWEWCADWYDDYPAEAVENPKGAATGTERIIRGGGWFDLDRYVRSAQRYHYIPTARYTSIGFRLACTLVSGGGA